MSKKDKIRNYQGQENRQTNDADDKTGFRNKNQAHDTRGEAQNVNDDEQRPLTGKETQDAINKANEGLRQGRNRS